ncbi:ornithine cyclodeaminase family protein [Rhizobium phaseoli]|uniref:ornithine cyclodeaminase family protein n=1 Tax=Rhizobium phaseoli TaxID=396 RepID=UPI001AEC887C|nr:NAD(P)-binding domain-containing protein [Rhizobium phaseoli]
MARADSRHLVILGAGAVAGTLARAYDAAFPDIERISIWSRRPEQAKALAATLGDLRAKVTAAADVADAVRAADIVTAATMARSPILRGEWVRPGTHVDLIGAFTPDMREADDALIAAGLVYVDFMETVMDRIGEIMQPIAAGAIERSHIRGDLYDLVAAGATSRQSGDQITVFKNGGGAHLDLMIASYVVDAVIASVCNAGVGLGCEPINMAWTFNELRTVSKYR